MTTLNQISAHMRDGDLARADAGLRKLVRQKAKSGIDWNAVMGVAGQLANHEAILAAARNWRQEAPSDPQRIMAEVTALGAVAKHKEAALLARSLQNHSVAASDGYSLEAFYQARFGRRDKAVALCRQALTLNRDHAHAWEQLSILGGYDNISNDIADMQRVEKTVKTQDQAVAIAYALGRAFDSTGDIDQAFGYFAKAAKYQHTQAPFDIGPMFSYLENLRSTFTPDFIKRHENTGAGAGAIFVLSLPRSGSTLTEQILSTSSAIAPTSEHSILRNAALALGTLEPHNMRAAEDFKQSDWRRIGLSYFDGLRKRFGVSKTYTDKTLIIYCFAGLIRILFPEAKMIWLTRDDRDVAWSCFRSGLMGASWSEDLETTCGFIKAHHQISAYWSELFGDAMMKVDYEGLVCEPGETIPAIFKHVGVETPDDWQAFHQNENPVATNSLGQVREPLNKKGLGSWRRYEKHLAPIFDQHF